MSFQYNSADNAHDLNTFIRAGWQWISTTGDGNWIQFQVRRQKVVK